MNEEIDDTDFYHHDFTTASEWEVFIARIEEILHEWKLTQTKINRLPPLADGEWDSQVESIFFADVEFYITRYFIKPPLDEVISVDHCEDDEEKPLLDILFNSDDEDFTVLKGNLKPAHSLARLYCLKDFVVITPAHNIENDNESKIKILLSSIYIAANNCNCETPIFLQIKEAWQQCYLGMCESRGIRTNFEMVHLKKGPQHCKYLTGLLDLFKTKIDSSHNLDPVTISAQFTYSLTSSELKPWNQESSDVDLTLNFSIDDVTKLAFGTTIDPINKIHLLATWQNLPENLIVDSENYTDFVPQQAPKWSVKIDMVESPLCLLSDHLMEFLLLCRHNQSIGTLLGVPIPEPMSENPLNRITESRIPSVTTVLKKATRHARKKSKSYEGPIAEDVLIPILYYLFPDADENTKSPYVTNKEIPSNAGVLKSCEIDSLIWRLAIVMANGVHSLGGSRTVAHLWFEFVQEMRFRWDNNILIPGISTEFPDSRTCLLNQKLQLLNCCIQRKKKNNESAIDPNAFNESDDDSFASDSGDEFFDCSAEQQIQKYSLWNQPTGRHSKYGNMKLITTGEPLYIPITQQPVPKTEDQLEEDVNVLLELGTDALGSELRAKMMSASLLSDMESFKAANPGAILEDFIRWYSPRDWIEEESLDKWGQHTGHLSSRMQIEDNMWLVNWESSKPVPARRQKRLFDETREAEKVLQYLETRNLCHVSELLLPTLTHAAICRLLGEIDEVGFLNPSDSISHIVKSSERVTRDIKQPVRHYEKIFQDISHIETQISQASSLKQKFSHGDVLDKSKSDFLNELITNHEENIEDGPNSFFGQRITYLFSEAHFINQLLPDVGNQPEKENKTNGSLFPDPSKREFILRVKTPRPTLNSTPTCQFLHAVLSKEEFRLAGAFSEDNIFF